MTNRTEYIEEAIAEYYSYGNQWQREYFNNDNGGYLVVEIQRIEQGNISKQEKEKYEKEYDMCLTLARNGDKVKYLKLTEGSFDIYLNDVSADLKKTKTHNNMVHYAKKAIREQGAKIVVFEFDTMTDKIHEELNRLKRLGIKVKYFTSKNKSIIKET